MSEQPQNTPLEDSKNNLLEKSGEKGESSRITRNRFGHIRTVWRMLIYLGIVVLAWVPFIGILLLLSLIFPSGMGGEEVMSGINIIFMAGIDFALVLGAWITLRRIDHRPFALLGMSFSLEGLKEFFIGLIFGILYLTSVVLILWMTGWANFSFGNVNSQVLLSMSTYLVFFGVAGFLEEVVNRGYLFQAFIEGTRAWIAILIFSLVFSLGHILNEELSWVGGLNLFLHGILFSLAYLKTRSLWVPIGIHVAWNWAQGPLWGMNVSGTTIYNSFLVSVPKGPVLLSGGNFGAEGSLVTLVVGIGLVLYIWKARWIKPTQEKITLWQEYPSGYGLGPSGLLEKSNK
jgi:membrane protease YdiL (CAAX protease family)